jgi:hypothetical protein
VRRGEKLVRNIGEGEAHLKADNGGSGGFESGSFGSRFSWQFGPRARASGGGGGGGAISLDRAVRARAMERCVAAIESLF